MFSMSKTQAQQMIHLNNLKMMVNIGAMLREMDKVERNFSSIETMKMMATFWGRIMKDSAPMMAKIYGSLVLGPIPTKMNIIKALIAETKYGYSEKGIKEGVNIMLQGLGLDDQPKV